MATAAALVFGLVSYAKLPLSLFPELTYPTLTVRTGYPGAAPEEVEEAVLRPIEELVATVDGLVSMRSVARADGGDVVLEFGWGWSMVAAAQDVRERMDLLQLPDEVKRPLLLRYDPSLDPILRLGLVAPPGGMSLGELRDYADRTLRRELERISGVAAVSVLGGEEREVSVAMDGRKLAVLELSVAQVAARLRAENVNLAGGDLSEGSAQYLVRTLHELRSLDAVRDLVVHRRGDAFVRLGDVAEVSLQPRRATHRVRFLGREGVELAVFKEADANIVATARGVRARLPLDDAQPKRGKRGKAGKPTGKLELPAGLRTVVLTDQSRFIEAALDEVRNAALLGGLLAMLVLYLFLRRLRTTLVAAVAIPVSVGVTFAPLYIAGVSLNIMSLGGLALGIGMLVDNAVVVLESIARRHQAGDSIAEAARRGTSEVGGAVVAATATTVAVFAPMVFVEGVAGQVFGDLALSVVVALLASLAVALTLIPMLASRGLDKSADESGRAGLRDLLGRYGRGLRASLLGSGAGLLHWLLLPYRLLRTVLYGALGLLGLLVFAAYSLATALVLALLRGLGRLEQGGAQRVFQLVDRGYQLLEESLVRLLSRSFVHPSLALGPALVATLLAVLALRSLGSSLVPEVHQGLFDVRITLPVGTPLEETARQLAPVERELADHPEVALLSSFMGVSDELWQQSAEGEHTAQLRVRLVRGGDIAAREMRVMQAARQVGARLPGAQVQLARPVLFSFAAPIELHLVGLDLEALQRAATQVLERLRQLPALTDLETTAVEGFPEVRVALRSAALAQLGLEADQVAQTVRDQVHGRTASLFRPPGRSGERFDIVVRGDLGALPRVRDLASLPVGHVDGTVIPLAAVADLETGLGPVDIRHVNGSRAVVIEAGLQEDQDLATAVASIRAALTTLELPVGVDVKIAGQDVEREQAMRSLRFAILLAAFLVFAVLAAQFESLRLPLLVMAAVPLGLVGAVLGLAITGTAVSVLVLIGAITLVGIVVNNAIVLLDRVRREEQAGAALEQALETAVRMRLRPILMTTLTTVFGLLPLALSRGEGAEIRSPIAVTLISGLLVSTLLTLVVVPVLVKMTSRRRRDPVA